MKLDKQTIEYAVLGGSILGGGGGGDFATGKRFASLAVDYTNLSLVDINDIDEDALLLTVSMVGAPKAEEKFYSPADCAKTIELFTRNCDAKIGGIMTNECGGGATVNGWLQAALTGLPLIDAACNGRAHPTGVMGSLNLHKDPNYITTQSFAGGHPETGRRVCGVVQGSIEHTSKLVRVASVEAGGVVVVARNPVTVAYAKQNAAVGAISQSIEIGKLYSEGLETSPEAAMEALCKALSGKVIARGVATEFALRGEGGFDVGRVMVDGMELTFWNEYMTAEKDGKRLSTFPDLMMTFDAKTGQPLTTAMIEDGMELVVFATEMNNLKLSSTMYERDLLATCEPILNKKLNDYHNFK